MATGTILKSDRVFMDGSNTTSFTIKNPYQTSNRYTYALVMGGYGTGAFMYLVRCGTNDTEIVGTKIFSSITGDATFARNGADITITFPDTTYGGIRVLWLG